MLLRDVITYFATHFLQQYTYASLDLASYPGTIIGDAGAKALSMNTNIRNLIAPSQSIGLDGAKALSRNTTITSLNLKSNEIASKGAKALSHNTTITSL